MKSEEIKKLRNGLVYDIENTPNGDRIWTVVTKDFVDLLGKALNELEESEEKPMLHNVTVKHEENRVLKSCCVMYGIKENDMPFIEPSKEVIKKQELDHELTPQEIAQFLSDSKADFVSVVQNYRFEN